MQWIKEVELVYSVDDFKIFVITTRYFNDKFRSTRCEDCFSTEQNHPYFSFSKKNQSGGTKGPEAGPVPSRLTDCLLDLRLLSGHWEPWFCRKLFRLVLRNDDIQKFDSEWDEILLSMTKIPHDDILERIVQIKNTRVWESQDRIGIARLGDSSKENRTWQSQIDNFGAEKYRARFTK